MHAATPLPEGLRSQVFTRKEALAGGLTPWRLRGKDIAHVGYGLYRHVDTAPSILDRARPICSEVSDTWVSAVSGASVHGLWLPNRLASDALHISRIPPDDPPDRRGVVGHQARLGQGELVHIDGVPVSNPARCWIELSRYLTEDELICLGDHLVRQPRRAFEQRTKPYATIESLRKIHEAHRRRPGSTAAARALAQIRMGADSPPETSFRLALVRAGLPEPELQVLLDPSDPYSASADLGYRQQRLALQYDGADHLDPERQSRDNRRDAAFSLAGWTVVKANRDDLRDGFQRVIRGIQQFFR